jgi:transcription termination/antitermination protein NusA
MTTVSPFSIFRGLRNKLTHMDTAPTAPPPAPGPVPEVRRAAPEVEDALRDIPGILESMLIAFGRNGIKTVEDLAACATDDLIGWTEQSGGKTTNHPGILGDMVLSRQQCDAIILQARIRMGWIEAAALPS